MKKNFYQLKGKLPGTETFIEINAITSYGIHSELGFYIICGGHIFKGLEKKEYEEIKKILEHE